MRSSPAFVPAFNIRDRDEHLDSAFALINYEGVHDAVNDTESEAAPELPVTVNCLPAGRDIDLRRDEIRLPISTAHSLGQVYNDLGFGELPCREEGECEAITRWCVYITTGSMPG